MVLGAGWLVGTALAVGLSVRAIDVVTASVTEQPPAALSAGGVSDALTDTGTPTTTGDGRPSAPTPVATPGPTSPTTAGAPTTTGKPATTTTRPTTTTTHPTATTARPTTAATTHPTPPTTGEHDGDGNHSTNGSAEDRTYQLKGGSVGVRFENGSVHLLWATPAPGFTVERSGSGDSEELEVRFRSDAHESRLRAYWDNGPQAEVEEREH